MQIGDIYKSKKGNVFIRIDSFITRLGEKFDRETNPLLIVVNYIQVIDEGVSFCPSDNQYGTQEDIEKDYDLYLSSDKLTPMNYDEEMNKIKQIVEDDYKKFESTLNKLIEKDEELQIDLKKIWQED